MMQASSPQLSPAVSAPPPAPTSTPSHAQLSAAAVPATVSATSSSSPPDDAPTPVTPTPSGSIRLPTATAAPPRIAAPQLGELGPNDPFFDQARLFLVTLSHVPQILAVAVLTPNLWKVDIADNTCSRELVWVVVQAIYLTLSLANYWAWFWLVYWSDLRPTLTYRNRTRGISIATKTHAALYVFGLLWFMVGNALLLVIDADSKACQADHDNKDGAGIHDLGLVLLTMAYARVLWPCTLIVLGLPFLLLCRPCVLRFLSDPTREMGFGMDGTVPGVVRGASKTIIEENTKRVQFDKGMDAPGADMGVTEISACCCICLVDYEPGDSLRVLPCGHEFHDGCVDEWLMRNATCPTCRKGLTQSRLDAALQEVDAIV